MRAPAKKIIFVFATVFLVSTIGSATAVQASFLDSIRALVTINPLRVSVSVPGEVELGKAFRVEAKVINKGAEKIENAEAEIFLPAGLVLVRKNPIQEVRVIPGRKEKKVFWSVKGEQLGNFGISASAQGELRGDIISAQGNTVIVTVIEKPPPGRPLSLFQSFFDILRGWFDNFE